MFVAGLNVTEKVRQSKIGLLYFPTTPSYSAFCTTWRNAEIQKEHPCTQMLYYYIARLQPVAGLIYSVLLHTTHARAAVWLPKSRSQWR